MRLKLNGAPTGVAFDSEGQASRDDGSHRSYYPRRDFSLRWYSNEDRGAYQSGAFEPEWDVM